MRIGEISWPRLTGYLDQEQPMILIPVSPVEEHGPHLPLGTDFLITQAVALAVAEQLHCVVYPVIPLMCCGISRDTTGTYPIEAATLKAIVQDLVRGFAEKGFKRIFFLSAHHGYSIGIAREAIAELAEVLEQAGCVAGVITPNEALKLPLGLLETPRGQHTGEHAGEVETSLAMALFPDLVGELPPADYHEEDGNGKPMVLSRSGVHGDPTKATREKGEKIFQAAVEGVIAWIKDQEGHQCKSEVKEP